MRALTTLKAIALCMLYFFVQPACFSQNNYDKNLLEVNRPVEPTSAAMGKYGIYPVDYSNGLVQIKIPLYKFNAGELAQTLELSYHGGGIRVTEEATWVGLGWDLNFGGIITRTMHGFPDNEETSPLPDAAAIRAQMQANYNTTNNVTEYDELNKALMPDKSFKPDLYHYNFGGYTGTFFLNDTLIRPVSYTAFSGTLNNIVLPDGSTYKFLRTDNTVLIRKLMPNKTYGSTIYIDKIISPNKTDTISYTYQTDGNYTAIMQSYFEGVISTNVTPLVLGQPVPPSTPSSSVEQLPLSTEQMTIQKVTSIKPQYIFFPGGRITFNLTGDRLDLSEPVTERLKKLDNIVIERKEGTVYTVIKAIRFYYSYFNPLSNDYQYKRLCLDSVVEFPTLQSVERKLIARFDYYGNKTLPSKKSYASDYWGFYNGKSNTSPIPRTNMPPYTIGSADKSPDENFALLGSLKSITYTTKGKTEFIWEGNKINYTGVPGATPYIRNDALLFFNPTSDILCYNEPAPFYTKSITVRSYTDQSVIVNYYLYQKDILDPVHKRLDKGDISLNGGIITSYLAKDATPRKLYLNLKKNTDYTFTIKTNCSNVEGSVSFTYNAYNPATGVEATYPFAGLRIKEIKNLDINGITLTHKKFEYINPSGKSSGLLTHNKPITYIRNSTLFDEGSAPNGINLYTIEKNIVYSNQYSGTEASNFMYEYVKEFYVDNAQNNNSGYTLYQFSKADDIFYNNDIPIINQSHLRGRLVNQKDYKKTATGYDIVNETLNEYSGDSRITYKTRGFAMEQNYEFTSPTALAHGLGTIDQTLVFNPVNYEYLSDWVYLTKSTEKSYITPTTSIATVTEYIYNSAKHLLPGEIKFTNSNGDVIKTKTLYPSDINTGVFLEMAGKNMLSYPIDIKKYVARAGQTDKLTGGKYNLYEKNLYGHIVLKKVSEYLSTGTLDDLFEYKYNAKSRLAEMTGKDKVPNSVYWDVLNMYPLVMATNMTYETLANAVKTNYSPFTFPTSPVCANAQVVTYTYRSLIGMASRTNPNGLTTYFEYDTFGRLKNIKDHNGKITEQYDYFYKP